MLRRKLESTTVRRIRVTDLLLALVPIVLTILVGIVWPIYVLAVIEPVRPTLAKDLLIATAGGWLWAAYCLLPQRWPNP